MTWFTLPDLETDSANIVESDLNNKVHSLYNLGTNAKHITHTSSKLKNPAVSEKFAKLPET